MIVQCHTSGRKAVTSKRNGSYIDCMLAPVVVLLSVRP
jgi:hypothetical protein